MGLPDRGKVRGSSRIAKRACGAVQRQACRLVHGAFHTCRQSLSLAPFLSHSPICCIFLSHELKGVHKKAASPIKLVMQNDGNLVQYNQWGKAMWTSGTAEGKDSKKYGTGFKLM